LEKSIETKRFKLIYQFKKWFENLAK
jgi:hypothetical protein